MHGVLALAIGFTGFIRSSVIPSHPSSSSSSSLARVYDWKPNTDPYKSFTILFPFFLFKIQFLQSLASEFLSLIWKCSTITVWMVLCRPNTPRVFHSLGCVHDSTSKWAHACEERVSTTYECELQTGTLCGMDVSQWFLDILQQGF